MASPIDDVEFLVASDHRVTVLQSLRERPCSRTELRTATGASSATVGRILSDFEDRHWIDREGRDYELTGLGTFVADRMESFVEAMTTEQRLREVSPWLPFELEGFGVELLGDPVVSSPGQRYPYEPVERNVQLLAETKTLRGFGMVMLKASVLEEFFASVLEGMQVEMVYPPAVFETIHAWDPETVAEALAHDTYSVYLHDDLPNSDWCGISLLDDRTTICCYEPETGMLRSLVDTDAPEAYEWGEAVVERYRAEARPLEDVADLDPDESSQPSPGVGSNRR